MPEVIFGIVALLSIGLYVREYFLRRRSDKIAKITEEDKLKFGTIAELSEKAAALNKTVEQDAQKLVSDARDFSGKATQNFATQLNQFLEYEEKQTGQAVNVIEGNMQKKEVQFETFLRHLTDVMNNKTDSSLKEFSIFLQTLREDSQKSQAANWEGAKTRVNELFENFETKLADFLLQTEQKMMLSVDLELKSARQLIDTYKVQQMNIIDENIVAMLEKTLSLVLAKNLNLRDQVDLVYESLERAKTESFLV